MSDTRCCNTHVGTSFSTCVPSAPETTWTYSMLFCIMKPIQKEQHANGDFIEEVRMMDESELINLDKAMNDSNWLAAMQEELREIEKNKTWELVKNSINKAIDVNWVYKLKLRPNGGISKHKARPVGRGFFFFLANTWYRLR